METRRWAVALASDNAVDLKMARALFEIGDPRVGEIKALTGRLETALFSDQFEKMSAATDVADASTPIIDAINGICFIHDPARSPLHRSGVHMRLPTGEWDSGTVFASVAMSIGKRLSSKKAIICGYTKSHLSEPVRPLT
jgi:hypothetical protein